ncbi:MAG: hypothetical protein V1898_04980 [Patescibacteria group bacterium]
MLTADQIEEIAKMKEADRIKLAIEALHQYKQIINKLSHKQRQVVLKAMKRIGDEKQLSEIEKLHEEIHKL